MARKYGNLETQHLSDRLEAEKAPKAPAFGKEEESKEQTDHENVVEQHGKAHTIHIKHDHARGVHHVHSIHESGHEHHAKFGTAEEAHDHAAKMAGSQEHEGLEDKAAEALNEAGHPGNYEKASALGVGTMEE
jgi:hypothetical protein